MTIEKALSKYGFTEKEVVLYVCILKYANLSVLEIAKKTGIPRTSIYHMLEAMKKKGIVTSFLKNNIVRHMAENPKHLVNLLKEKEDAILEVMPDIRNLMDSAGKNPTAKIYLGEAGVKFVFEDVLETLEKEDVPIMHAVSQIDVLEAFPRFFPEWLKRRRDIKKTFTQLIVPGSAKEKMPEMFRSQGGRETRFLPPQFSFESSIEIYGSKTATISLQEGEYHSIIIDSPTVTNTFRQFFLFAWGMIEGNKI